MIKDSTINSNSRPGTREEAFDRFARKPSSDVIKRFVQPSKTVSGGGNGVTSLEDPTYLGFSLRFDILSPLFNGATTGDPMKPPSESPLSDAVIGSLIKSNSKNTLDNNQPLPDPNIAGGESAFGYLMKVGEKTRASYLQMFTQGLREVNEFRPYYWQTINGLEEAWTKSLSIIDPFQGTADEDGITIGCLEALDLKISALFNLYKAAVLDVEYRRMVLPNNLKHFSIYIDVYEIRRFKAAASLLSIITNKGKATDVDRFLNENTSRITFKLEDCEWILSQSGKVFENVTNLGGADMTTTSMKFKFGKISIISDFSGIDQELNDSARNQHGGKLGDAVKNATKNQALKAGEAFANRAASSGTAAAQSLLFGNAFGLRNQIIAGLQNPGALSNIVSGALLQNRSGGGNGGNIKLGDNILGSVDQPSSSLTAGNVTAGLVPRNNLQLRSSNVFGSGPSGPPPLTSNNVFN
jgi:hypothetical protein